MLLGAHESTAGGLPEAWPRAAADGAEAVQIFTKSNRMWHARPLGAEETSRFRAEGQQAGLLATASVHASYLINLGAGEGEGREKSVAALADELLRCQEVGVDKLVLHPGSNPDLAKGIANIADGLARSLAASPGQCRVLLETAAGQGSSIGRTFEELQAILAALPKKLRPRVAICLDTCHVFAAGYDLSSPAGFDQTFEQFEALLGLELLQAFHLNDSKKPLGCRVDRHERPGLGCIGEGAFQRLVNDDRFKSVPGYLELPPEDNRSCLDRLKGWRRGSASNTGTGRKQTARKPRVAPGPARR